MQTMPMWLSLIQKVKGSGRVFSEEMAMTMVWDYLTGGMVMYT